MMRILALVFWGVLVWLVISAFRRRRVAQDKPQSEVPRSDSATAQTMVRCAHCGVHLPELDALADADARYCSEEHRRLGPKKP